MDVIKTEDQIFDVRLIERHIKKGLITRKDCDRYLKSLSDSNENMEMISFESICEPKPKKAAKVEPVITEMEDLETLGSEMLMDFTGEEDFD